MTAEAVRTAPPPKNTQRRGLRACAARRTFSRTLSAGKTWQRWKVRAIPFCATRCTGRPVISSPAKNTSPACGLSVLVMRLNTVDFPAPFGPITARISPGSSFRLTPSTATSAPKRRTSPRHSSSGIFPEQTPETLGREQHERHEHRAEDERPEVGHLRKLVLEEHEEHRAEDRSDQRAGAADDHHDEHVARGEPEEQLRRGIAREAGVQRAREPAEAVGENHGGDLVRARVVAQRHGLGLVLSDTGKHRTERRAHDRAAQEIRTE